MVDVLPMFGLILQNVVLTLKDPETGEVKTLSMNDVNQRISNEFPNDYHGLRGIQINCVDANTLQTQHIDTADAGKKE